MVAIIQTRLTSSRLPLKVLKKIGSKTILQHTIDRVKKSKYINEVVVASPHRIPNHIVEVWDTIDEDDVLSRYYFCACVHEADVIVRITSDCPFIDPLAIDIAIKYYLNSPFEYVCFAPFDGSDVEVFSYKLLNETWLNAKDKYDREHVTPYMRRKTKLSIDTMDDLKRARRWYGLQRKDYLDNRSYGKFRL